MRRTFNIPIAPFSINAYHYADKRHKTREARDWETKVLYQLNKPAAQKSFAELRAHFDLNKHVYSANLIAYYPESTFFTAKGLISQRTLDLTNWEKPIIDLLFLPKHYNNPEPYGCKNLNIDDKFLGRMFSTKKPSLDGTSSMLISLRIIPAVTFPGP
jgi:hypothetical protein